MKLPTHSHARQKKSGGLAGAACSDPRPARTAGTSPSVWQVGLPVGVLSIHRSYVSHGVDAKKQEAVTVTSRIHKIT